MKNLFGRTCTTKQSLAGFRRRRRSATISNPICVFLACRRRKKLDFYHGAGRFLQRGQSRTFISRRGTAWLGEDNRSTATRRKNQLRVRRVGEEKPKVDRQHLVSSVHEIRRSGERWSDRRSLEKNKMRDGLSCVTVISGVPRCDLTRSVLGLESFAFSMVF